jgi:HAD superfamily hydrolase (TIGR01509 family)
MANNIENAEKIKTVAMDFDGVITSLDIDWKAAIRQASAIAGYDIKSLNLFYEECFGTLIFQKISSEMEKIELEAAKKSSVFPFVKESLQKLAEKQIGVYIVSMQSFGVVKEFLDQHGLNGYFKGIIVREKCSGKKAQVQCLLKETGNSPREILLIDDSKRNIDVCGELGVSCFHFQNRFHFNKKAAKEKWDEILFLVRNCSRMR